MLIQGQPLDIYPDKNVDVEVSTLREVQSKVFEEPDGQDLVTKKKEVQFFRFVLARKSLSTAQLKEWTDQLCLPTELAARIEEVEVQEGKP